MGTQQRPLYDPALIQRDDQGEFWHPDLPYPEGSEQSTEDVDIGAELDKQGYTWARVEGDCPDEIALEAGDAYWAWLRAWQPEPPEGEGWLLAVVADTEDGPFAWYVRPKG